MHDKGGSINYAGSSIKPPIKRAKGTFVSEMTD
jgi:hypothetical protein